MSAVGSMDVWVAAVVCLTIAVGGATLAGMAWRRVARGPDGLMEPALAVVGLIGTASVLTGGLMLVWRVPWGGARSPPEIGDPLFAAALIGTVGGHLAVLAWARALGAPLALTRTRASWVLAGGLVGCAGLFASAVWSAVAAALGHPLADQELVTTVLSSEANAGRIATVFFVVAVAPVLEELVFRGYLLTAIRARVGPVAAIASTAVLFGLFHLSDPAVVPALAVIGALLGWVRQRSGSVYPAIAAHLVNNIAAMAIALA